MAEILRTQNITKIYDNGIVASSDVNIQVEKGEIHAICGENGAGKSTLMKILFGLILPDRGQIFVRGEEVKIQSPKIALQLKIGMVHQHFMLVPSLSVAQNVVLGYEPTKGIVFDDEKAVRMTQEISEKYNLAIPPRELVRDICVGIKQKVEIAKALLRGAEILILDEPTAVLTPQETRELFAELKNLKSGGHTILFISHKLREVKELCDRITIMRAGKTIGTYNTADLSQGDISKLMVGRDVVLTFDKKEPKIGKNTLSVRNLSYINTHKKTVLNNVSFDVRAGEILGVAGILGNGQNELTEIITGLKKASSGSVKICGTPCSGIGVAKIRALGQAHIPADRMALGVAKQKNIKLNILSGKLKDEKYCKKGFLKHRAIDTDIKKLVKDYNILCHSSEQTVDMLSGGNVQKVVVAREMSNKPLLLVADQPTHGIDVGSAEFIRRKIIEMRDAGVAVLLITADLNEALELSDSIIVMQGGEIVAYHADTKTLSEEELGYYMLCVKRQDPEEIMGAVHE